MAKVKIEASKRYPGVYTRSGERGKSFYIMYRVNGRQVKEKVGDERDGCTLSEAAQVRTERLRKLRRQRQQLPLEPSDFPTFGTIAKDFLDWADDHKRSAKTDRQRYSVHLEERFASRRADWVTAQDVKLLMAELLGAGKAPATVVRILALLRVIYNKAKEGGLIDFDNPVSGVDLPEVHNESRRYLKPDEITVLFDAVRKLPWPLHGLALLSYWTAARFGEIAALQWRDVHLDAPTIAIWDTKSGDPRSIPLAGEAAEFLEGLEPGEPDDYVFTDANGAPYRKVPHALRRVLDELFNKGVTDRRYRTTFHTLRHSAATLIAAGGASAVTLRDALGHKTLAMSNRYAKRADEALRRALVGLPPTKPAGPRKKPRKRVRKVRSSSSQ